MVMGVTETGRRLNIFITVHLLVCHLNINHPVSFSELYNIQGKQKYPFFSWVPSQSHNLQYLEL